MTLTVNFQAESFPDEVLSLRALLERKRWSFPLIIAKVNGAIVERGAYDERLLQDGDEVELYHLVSGG